MRRKLLITIDALAKHCGKCRQVAALSCWCREYRKTLEFDGPGKPVRLPQCLKDEERAKHGPTTRAR